MVPVATSVSADETEALKAEITKAVEKVQEAGKAEKTNTAFWIFIFINVIECVLYSSFRSKHPDLICM